MLLYKEATARVTICSRCEAFTSEPQICKTKVFIHSIYLLLFVLIQQK